MNAREREQGALSRLLLLLAPAIAIVVASEFIVVGLLPQIANDLGLSLAKAGQLTALFALSAAVAGPFITLIVSRQSPRWVLVISLLIFAMGNAAMAFVSSFPLMILARIVQGALLPAFISVGTAEVTRLAPSNERGSALARANIGFVVGVLIALPAGIALAQAGNWRLPFLVLMVAPAIMAVAIFVFFPSAEMKVDLPSIAGQLGLLFRPFFLGHLLMSVLLFAAMFSSYTFLGAWLVSEMGLSVGQVAITLCIFGTVGLAGNALAVRVADDFPMAATAVAVVALVLAVNAAALWKISMWTAAFPLAIWSLTHTACVTLSQVRVTLAGSDAPAFAMTMNISAANFSMWTAAFPLAIWSLTHTACVTLSQVRVTLAGSDAPAFAMTMNISAANLGIAIGAFAGGWTIDHLGLEAIGVVPACLVLVVLLLAIFLKRREPQSSERVSALRSDAA